MTSRIITDQLQTDGNMVIKGEAISVESTTVTTQDNLIIINRGEVGTGVTLGFGGFDVDRGLAKNYRFAFDESDDTFRIGEYYIEFYVTGDTGLQPGEEITGGTSGARGRLVSLSATPAGTATVCVISGMFQNPEVITGTTSTNTATITLDIVTNDETQAIATRADSMNNEVVPKWNSTTNRFESSGVYAIDGSTYLNVYGTLIFDDAITIAAGGSGDRTAIFTLETDDTYSDGVQILKTGVNGQATFTVRGTGGLDIKTKEAGAMTLGTSDTTRMTISSGGLVTFSNGAVKITGTDKATGQLYSGTTDPTLETDRLNYDGHFYATKVYNAVWNDYADYWPLLNGEIQSPGYCYSETGRGLIKSNIRADKSCIGICTDTYGMAVGKANKGIPIAVAGYVLAHTDKIYTPGTLLVSGKNGKLTKARWYEILLGRCIAKFLKVETEEVYNDKIKVSGRHWVKII